MISRNQRITVMTALARIYISHMITYIESDFCVRRLLRTQPEERSLSVWARARPRSGTRPAIRHGAAEPYEARPVLEAVGLVESQKMGAFRTCRLKPAAMTRLNVGWSSSVGLGGGA